MGQAKNKKKIITKRSKKKTIISTIVILLLLTAAIVGICVSLKHCTKSGEKYDYDMSEYISLPTYKGYSVEV